MDIKHPVDRGGEGRGAFGRAAEAASNLSSSPAFFALCMALIALWAASYIGHLSEGFQHVVADAMAALTLALVALLKNAERRSERAVQEKLDLIAGAMLDDDTGEAKDRLREAIGLHDEL